MNPSAAFTWRTLVSFKYPVGFIDNSFFINFPFIIPFIFSAPLDLGLQDLKWRRKQKKI
jgi:hypothetical protein